MGRVEMRKMPRSHQLARGPFHRSPAKQMKVQVIDRLTAIGAAIRDDAITSLESRLFGHLPDHMPEMCRSVGRLAR